MLDTHEKVKNALSNGAEETPAEPEVMEIEDTPQVPLLGDDASGFKFGEVKPAKKMPKHYGWIPHNSSFGFLDIARATLGVFASLDRF